MESLTPQKLEELNSSPVEQVVQVVRANLSSWKELIVSVSTCPATADDSVFIAIVKTLGKICSEHREKINDANGESEALRQELRKILMMVCNQDFFTVVTTKVINCGMIHSIKRERLKNESLKEQSGELLLCLLHTCRVLIRTMPFTAKDACANFILVVLGILNTPSYLGKDQPTLLQGYQSLQEAISAVSADLEKENASKPAYGFSALEELRMHGREPPEDFRTIPVIPTLQELVKEKHPFLRPNKLVGGYMDVEHYLDVQFRLLREDFVWPLRKGVQDFLQSKDEYLSSNGRVKRRDEHQNNGVRYYNGVTFHQKEMADDKSVEYHLFKLSASLMKKMNWEKSKRLKPGTLVLLTSDLCNTASFATVMATPPQRNKMKTNHNDRTDPRKRELIDGILRVSIETGKEFIKGDESYVMLECEAFFEAYRYNLSILQQTNLNDFPLAKFLINSDTSIASPPSYFFNLPKTKDMVDVAQDVAQDLNIKLPFLTEAPVPADDKGQTLPSLRINRFAKASRFTVNQSDRYHRVSIRNTETWPSETIQKKMGLDENQYQAYKAALTSEIAIIQGPPGTGKTFIGLKIVQTLLLNKTKGNPPNHLQPNDAYCPNSPILVVCYTNHALDQFLELLSDQKTLQIVRVGSRSKSETLRRSLLHEHRKRFGRQTKVHEAETALSEIEKRLRNLHDEIDTLSNSNFTAPINFGRLDEYVQRCLKRLVPGQIMKMLENPANLGLDERDFTAPRFSAAYHLRQFFQFKNKDSRQLPTESSSHRSYHYDDYISEAELMNLEWEDCELDQWAEQLIQDRIKPKLKFHVLYFKEWSTDHLLSTLIEITQSLIRTEREFQEHCKMDHEGEWVGRYGVRGCRDCKEIYAKYISLKERRIFNKNKWKFMVGLFHRYKEKLIELPDSSQYFQMEKLKTSKNKKSEAKKENGKLIVTDGLDIVERWSIYFHVLLMAKEIAKLSIPIMEGEIDKANEAIRLERKMVDGGILKRADIIGMTTTGASKHHDLLKIAKPEIVIIEEAAEILEAHTVTSITKHCKHLVLIGDHLQLRPSTNVYHLARKFHLDLSLFERMVNNNMNLWSLGTQRRMRPEISNLIVGSIYSELNDHPKVLHHPDVRGVAKNLFFISHNELEHRDNVLQSFSNIHEAEFIGAFCNYLLRQGYSPGKITILTTYTGQMFTLKNRLQGECTQVHVTCVDSYQGEENDIIILSLVRSNEENKIGFVGIDNRICVSLSRAKHGLFIMGNMRCLTSRSETWKQIFEKLSLPGNTGESLSLKCERHKTITQVKKAKDFTPLKLGGCKLPCEFKLPCDHLCALKCHGSDLLHEKYKCKESCDKLCKNEAHPCPSQCFRECPPCMVKVIKKLNCGHEEEMDCWDDPTQKVCQVVVPRTLPKCGHEKGLQCHIDHTTYSCKQIVKKLLDCDHSKEVKCHVNIKLIKCQESVEKTLVPCGHNQSVACCVMPSEARCLSEVNFVFPECRHERKLICWEVKTAKCIVKCEASLKCGHQCRLPCHATKDPKHEEYACMKKCRRQCEGSERHECSISHPCHQPCPSCNVTVTKSLPCNPKHVVPLACHDDGKNFKCQYQVSRQLDCGHIISMECHDTDVSKIQCGVKVTKTLPCGHEEELKCSDSVKQMDCHRFKLMTCSNCQYQRNVLCCFTTMLGCPVEGCRRKYAR